MRHIQFKIKVNSHWGDRQLHCISFGISSDTFLINLNPWSLTSNCKAFCLIQMYMTTIYRVCWIYIRRAVVFLKTSDGINGSLTKYVRYIIYTVITPEPDSGRRELQTRRLMLGWDFDSSGLSGWSNQMGSSHVLLEHVITWEEDIIIWCPKLIYVFVCVIRGTTFCQHAPLIVATWSRCLTRVYNR